MVRLEHLKLEKNELRIKQTGKISVSGFILSPSNLSVFFSDEIEVISSKDAAKFPIMASITLFSIYMCYKYFADKMYYLVTGYFFLLGY